jgi:hypothetical protein
VNRQDTIKKLQTIIVDLRHAVDSLDGTYDECQLCNRRTYTNPTESRLKLELTNKIHFLEQTIAKLER